MLAALAPAKIFACAACGSANANIGHSSMVDGMNLAILTLGAILLPVLGAFLALLIYAIRKSEAVEAARTGQGSRVSTSPRPCAVSPSPEPAKI